MNTDIPPQNSSRNRAVRRVLVMFMFSFITRVSRQLGTGALAAWGVTSIPRSGPKKAEERTCRQMICPAYLSRAATNAIHCGAQTLSSQTQLECRDYSVQERGDRGAQCPHGSDCKSYNQRNNQCIFKDILTVLAPHQALQLEDESSKSGPHRACLIELG